MEKAKWIWYPGDYEAYHTLQLHGRREKGDITYPAMWSLPTPYPEVTFLKEVDLPEDTEVTVLAKGQGFFRWQDGPLLALGRPQTLPKGHWRLEIRIYRAHGLPAIYIDSPYIKTNEGFTVTVGGDSASLPQAACGTPFYGKEGDPERFPFRYTPLTPVSVEQVAGGMLYDFGKETFGPGKITGTEGRVGIFYGESREEALSSERDCTIWEYTDSDKDLAARAFRFIHLRGVGSLSMQEELLDLPYRGSFSCDDERVAPIWQTCARTFHLCAREFFLDGIKRDRWVWSGDARQALLISNYLFADREIPKRTLLSLFPKDIPHQHVNTINDYTLYMFISLWEYYESFGDLSLVRFLWPRAMALYRFMRERLEDGLMVKRPGDWIFIDWAEMDMEGPIAAEQILLWYAEKCLARLARLLGEDGDIHEEIAAKLRERILALYWDEEKGAFIDSYTSGRRNVSRHANIFAILFDFVDEETAKGLVCRVLKNEGVRPIITPYFKLYELMALCKMGDLAFAQGMLGEYWGQMLEMGATSMWEHFDPTEPIPACYGMYGEKYGKSLCHAWSCGPIYFLGRYCLGVYPEEPGYERFTVAPQKGLYRAFSGVVPTEKGEIRVSYKDGEVTVLSQIPGGTLRLGGKEFPILPGEPLVVKAEI